MNVSIIPPITPCHPILSPETAPIVSSMVGSESVPDQSMLLAQAVVPAKQRYTCHFGSVGELHQQPSYQYAHTFKLPKSKK